MNKRLTRFSISAAAVLVLATGCSSSGSPAGMPAPETAPSSVPSVSMTHTPSHASTTSATAPDATEAAALRATLTSLLSDHVWLAGNTLDTAVQQKGDLKDPQVVGAVKALDANSVALAKAVGSVYPDAEKPFLATLASIAADSESTCGISSSATASAGSSGTTELISWPKETR